MIILGNINLFVRDVEKARQFYVDLLGLVEDKERSHPPSFALLQAGGCTITLQDGNTPGAEFGEANSIELGFAVADVSATNERLKQSGIEASDVQNMGWGSGFDARDLDGHRLTFYKMRDE